MSEKAAKLISVVFHPLLMPVYGFVLLLNTSSLLMHIPQKTHVMLTLMIFITTCLMPLLTMFFIKRQGLISSWYLEKKEERVLPYIITAIFFYFTYRLLARLELPVVFYNFILGAALLIVIALLINFRWKISAHMIGIGGLTGTFTGLLIRFQLNLNFLVAALILISGITAYARLKSRAHTQLQVYAGFTIGTLIMAVIMILLL